MTPLRTLFAGELPKLVMFDLDGTLLDSVPDMALAVDEMLQQLGREPAGMERVRNWVGNGALLLVRRALAGGVDCSAVDERRPLCRCLWTPTPKLMDTLYVIRVCWNA